MLEARYKHRIKERKMELRHIQEMQELRSSLEKQEYFTFSQAARLMGVSRQYIYKLVKEDKLRASRLSGRMALVRRADIELMLKSKPYERLVAKNDFDITEYYTAEEIAEKYKVNTKCTFEEIDIDLCNKYREYLLSAKKLRRNGRITRNSASASLHECLATKFTFSCRSHTL